jgi:hypothetical protein
MVALEGRNNSTRDRGEGRVGDWRAAERRVWRGPESAGHWLYHVKQGREGHGGQEWREEKDEGEVNVGVEVLIATVGAASAKPDDHARRGRPPKPEADFPATTLRIW